MTAGGPEQGEGDSSSGPTPFVPLNNATLLVWQVGLLQTSPSCPCRAPYSCSFRFFVASSCPLHGSTLQTPHSSTQPLCTAADIHLSLEATGLQHRESMKFLLCPVCHTLVAALSSLLLKLPLCPSWSSQRWEDYPEYSNLFPFSYPLRGADSIRVLFFSFFHPTWLYVDFSCPLGFLKIYSWCTYRGSQFHILLFHHLTRSCFSFLKLFWLFRIFWYLIQILWLFVAVLWKIPWYFDRNLIEFVDCLW